MAAKHADDSLTFKQEGSDVRATAGDLNILFPKSKKKEIVKAFEKWSPRVRSYFDPRWRTHPGANIPEADLEAIVREVTLQWMGFCVMHRTPIQMGEAEWNQPLTRRIIRSVVERTYARGSEDAAALCAQIMGLAREAYLKWAEGEESFLGLK
jgi:hypothetical protein